MITRKKRAEEHENHERWLVSYADFITLLFAFFVVLYATSTQNQEKKKEFQSSLRTELRLMGAGGAGDQEGGGLMGEIIEPIDLFQKRNIGNVELQDYVEKLLQKNLTEEERKLAIGGLRHDTMGVRISLAASTFFPSGQAKLRRPALSAMDKIAKFLKAAPNKIVIEGHTDDLPLVGGDFESNWELGAVRATSVVRYLTKVHGFDPSRLSAISYADTKPLVPNNSDQNRAQNRRIEILIVNNEPAQ
jgi:chemotaxis protein MotB